MAVSEVVDHLVVGSSDLDLGIEWVRERLGVAPVFGGTHDGFGTCNALLGLGDPYLEVLAIDPGQAGASSWFLKQVESLPTPAVLTIAVARSGLERPVPMSRVRADGVRLEWEVEFTSTPLFFINWKESPRPSGLPDGGRITALTVMTPEPELLVGTEGVSVQEGPWRVAVSVDGTPLT